MRVICNCPEIVSQWSGFAGRSAKHEAFGALEGRLWRAFAGNVTGWEIGGPVEGMPAGLGIIVDRSGWSQFDRLRELSRSERELPPLLVTLALAGDNFHGQGERPWRAELGNLHLSACFETNLPAAAALGAISILPTLAVMDAFEIEAEPAGRTGIRWLNDVFVKGRKLAGSIAASETEGDRIQRLFFGIGVNVETVPEVPGDAFVTEATSLRAAYPDARWTLGRATVALLRSLANRVSDLATGTSRLVADYRERSACVGREVKVWPKNTENAAAAAPLATGRLMSIDNSLAAHIQGARPIPEGRLAFSEDCRRFGL